MLWFGQFIKLQEDPEQYMNNLDPDLYKVTISFFRNSEMSLYNETSQQFQKSDVYLYNRNDISI